MREMKPLRSIGRGIIRFCGDKEAERLENARTIVCGMKGVTRAEANHISRILCVEYDPERVTLDEIRVAVRGEVIVRG